jgi:hypothetical protein
MAVNIDRGTFLLLASSLAIGATGLVGCEGVTK